MGCYQAKKKCLETVTFEQLPNEILLEIFTKMDKGTLLESLQVNKNWHRIITQSPATMKMLPLFVNDENLQNGHAFPKLTRRYDCVSLDEVYAVNSKLLRELMKIGFHVKKLNLNDCIFFEREFINLCRCFPNLENLTIRWCSMGLTSLKRTKPQPAVMEKLKKLMVWGEGWCLGHLDCSSLETLTLSRFYIDDQRELVKFLNAQASLKSLRLNDIRDLFTPRKRTEKIELDLKFQLREISLSNLEFADQHHLLTLLKQAENCETALIGHAIPPVVTQEILKRFRNLKFLFVDADQITSYLRFHNLCSKSLKFLKIGGTIDTSVQPLLGFLSVFPNLENLDMLTLEGLTSTNHALWRTMSEMLKNLKVLKIQRMNIFNMVELKFPLMTSCIVDLLGFTTSEAWETFSSNNPIVTTLCIKSTPLQIFFGADVMLAVKSLRHLEYFRNYDFGPHGPFALN